MISPSWKSLRRAKTKKITTIGRNKPSISLRARANSALPLHSLFFLFFVISPSSFDKGTKCLNRLADIYHNFLRASRAFVVVTAITAASYVERSSSPSWSSLASYILPISRCLTSRVVVRFPLVRPFDDNGNEKANSRW